MEESALILDRLIGLHPKIIDLSLDRMHRILAALGHPELSLPPVIHVAGTNGKGSTVAFMRAILEAGGQSVHVYTSPHLVQFHERVRLNGHLVAEPALVEALLECERANGPEPITYFEITTAAALLMFSRMPADMLLLEVGLGGRLDATNVIDRPLATVITPVGMDHAQYLGETIPAIASEKAGILKPGIPGIIAGQRPDALRVIEDQARKTGAPLSVSGREWRSYDEAGHLIFQDEAGLLDLPLPRLSGRHQIENAGTAIATLRSVMPGLSAEAIGKGLETVDWQGRMQAISCGPLLDWAPADAEMWIDGGHNGDAGTVLAETMAELEERSPKPLVLVSGMLTTKTAEAFFAPFSGLASEVITVPIPHTTSAYDATELAGMAQDAGVPARPAADLKSALASIKSGTPPRVLICGSLYLAGHALGANGVRLS